MGTREDKNKRLIERFIGCMAAGDMDPNLMTEDFSYTIIGNTKFSGTFDRSQMVSMMAQTYSDHFDDRFKFCLDDLIAEGDSVVAQLHGEGVIKDGRPYANRYCQVYRIAGDEGRVREIINYIDTDLVRSLFG